MGYIKTTVIACLLFAAVSAHASEMDEEAGPTQTQLEHMAKAMQACRLQTDEMISATEQDAQQKKGEAVYHLDGPKGALVYVDKTTFADFYLASCYQQKLAEDPVFTETSFVADTTPII